MILRCSKISNFCSALFAILILVSSITFTLDLHFCQGQLKSYSLFGKAKNCHEVAAKKKACPHHAKMESETSCSKEKKNCCSNETILLDAQIDQLFVQLYKVELSFDLFAEMESSVLNQKILLVPKKDLLYEKYKPPIITKNIPVLFESYLL